jgi:hypothetical protein
MRARSFTGIGPVAHLDRHGGPRHHTPSVKVSHD